jgi:hypothetical protein
MVVQATYRERREARAMKREKREIGFNFRNAFSRMHFAENSAFGKILKLFIRSDYAERNCVWLVF